MIFHRLKEIVFFIATISLLNSCAKEPSVSEHDNELQLIKATQQTYFPNAQPLNDEGSLWLISHAKVGSGATPQNGDYVAFDFTGKYLPNLGGQIFQTTDSTTARRLGTFSYDTHFAPIFIQDTSPISSALHEALKIMHVGDTLTVMSASWLYDANLSRIATNGEVATSTNPSILTLALREIAQPNPKERERKMVEDYVLAHPEKNFVQAKDSAGNLLSGFYISYVDTVPLDSAVLLDSAAHYAVTGDEVSVKFAGFYLQDNFLLDSNIDTIAQKYGWNTSDTTKYKVNWPYTFSENGENSGAIKAYSFAVQNIAPCSWVEFVFTSDYGYMEQGSQEIPQRPIYAYTPLRFKIYVAKITSNE